MRRTVLGMSMLAVVLWAATGVLAQGQGKGQGGGGKERVKDRAEGKAQENAPSAETAEKNAGKGKAAQQGDEGGVKGKQGGPQGKKGEKAGETPEKGKGKGKGQEQQAQAFQKQLQHEQAKHMERQARLTRIRELAVKKGDAEMIARVDKLIAQENEVYARKQGKMQGQPRATPAPTGPGQATPAPAGPNSVTTPPGSVAAPAPTSVTPPEQKGKGKQGEAKEQKKPEETKK